jgi:dTDP-6-deoxy-L-talose 4-dehydrogenase (NAD+)
MTAAMDARSKPRIAVTGAGGFVGRYVMAELAKRGLDAVAVVRSASALKQPLPSGRLVEIDLAAAGADAYERMGRPDVLIHLAWGGLPNYKSLHHFERELPSQFRFLKAMVDAGLPDLLVTGTCFEYGMQSGPLPEEAPARPANPYAFAKETLRQELQYLKALKPFRFTWARLFYVYGEGQHEGSIYPQLKAAILRGDKTFNMSGGEQLRDHIHVEEVAFHLVRLATAGSDIGTVNVCSGKPVSLRNRVEGWLREKDWKIELNLGHYPYPDHEPMAFWGVRDRLDSIPGGAD